ncbi:MAG: hypothetical protein KC917_17090 [Candidatus Omnitrophica bacterium]|nr:hypothetical protein [Candidatus Omnitrophota bacterium]
MVPTRVFFGACFLLCLMVIPSFGGIPKYEIVELTTPSEKGCGSIALNDRGEVLFRVHNDRNVTTHYLWTPEKGRVELANLGDGITSVIDLNDQGLDDWLPGHIRDRPKSRCSGPGLGVTTRKIETNVSSQKNFGEAELSALRNRTSNLKTGHFRFHAKSEAAVPDSSKSTHANTC